MNRQLYGIGNLVEREKYGLGSKLKKFVRNIIPNEVAKVATVAAPFVAPFNPLLAGAMAGLGSFDRTGSISSGLKAGALNYIGGKCYCYVDDFITHVGEYSYEGKFIEELINTRKIDESKEIK